MKIELHLIQNFAPSCLNRDDTNTPKDCEFGGVRRARISSQCLKRAIRKEDGLQELLKDAGGIRTRRLIVEIAERLSGKKSAPDDVVKTVSDVFKAGGIERPEAKKGEEAEKENTKLLLFMDAPAIDAMVDCFRERWDELGNGAKEAKDEAVALLGEILVNAVKAPDIALFGRMIEIDGKTPFGKLNLGVNAACQVAQAISTHKVDMDFDFYTAVDDLNPGQETGAGMMGVIGFNSACFYRYALVDRGQLAGNLRDEKLTDEVIRAFLWAAIRAVPKAKQNSMAAQNRPSFGMIVVRENGAPCSLANAFARPVCVELGDEDLIGRSVAALDRHWNTLGTVYGADGVIAQPVFCLEEANRLEHLAEYRKRSAAEAVDAAMAAVTGHAGAAA